MTIEERAKRIAIWRNSQEARDIMFAAEKAKKVFERAIKESEEYALRELIKERVKGV